MFRSISVLCIFVSAGTSLNFQQERWGSKNKSLTGLPNTQLIIARIALYSWSFLSKQYQSFLCTRTIEDKEHAWDTGSLFSASSNSAKHVSTSGLGLRQYVIVAELSKDCQTFLRCPLDSSRSTHRVVLPQEPDTLGSCQRTINTLKLYRQAWILLCSSPTGVVKPHAVSRWARKAGPCMLSATYMDLDNITPWASVKNWVAHVNSKRKE